MLGTIYLVGFALMLGILSFAEDVEEYTWIENRLADLCAALVWPIALIMCVLEFRSMNR